MYMSNNNDMRYEIDISYLEKFGKDFMEINVIWKLEYYVNGNYCISFPVNNLTKKWMEENYSSNEPIEFYIQ